MNRNQRRGRVPRRNDSTNRFNAFRNKTTNEVDEVRGIPKGRRDVGNNSSRFNTHKSRTNEIDETYAAPKQRKEEKSEKTVANRCCYVTPDQRDFGQSYGIGFGSPDLIESRLNGKPPDRYHSILTEQCGFDPIIPDTITQLKELKRVLCDNATKVENASQYAHQSGGSPPIYVETPDGTQWQNVENIEDIDNLIIQEETPVIYERLPKHIFISEVPHVKIIAEKFSKYKRNNLELRRLDEKVVCVEYDIFDQSSNGDVLKPVQRMRAFFSIKPVFDDGSENKEAGALSRLPSPIKHKFDIMDEDLKRLTEKEIEIIDGKIEENKSYLEDLRRILKRKQVINAKKHKTSLDLQSLYEMAKKNRAPLDCDFSDADLLSKAELQEVKDLILQRCTSSVHGIRRKRVKRRDRSQNGSAVDIGVISESIVAELLREDAKLNVFK